MSEPTPRAPKRRTNNDHSTAAQLAASEARFDELFRMVGEARGDAREARDGVVQIKTILEQQDVSGALAEMRAEAKKSVEDLRKDVVSANTRLRTDISEIGDRVTELEKARNKVIGIAEFFQWLSKVGPWLVALLAALWAGLERNGGS